MIINLAMGHYKTAGGRWFCSLHFLFCFVVDMCDLVYARGRDLISQKKSGCVFGEMIESASRGIKYELTRAQLNIRTLDINLSQFEFSNVQVDQLPVHTIAYNCATWSGIRRRSQPSQK